MFHKIWEFLTTHSQHAAVETIMIYLLLIAFITLIVLGILFIIKTNKDIKKMNKSFEKSKQKTGKNLINILKRKKNTTY